MEKIILEVSKLSSYFNYNAQKIDIIKNLSFNIFENEVVGLIGESGCGKTITAQTVLKLYNPKVYFVSKDSRIHWNNLNLLSCREKDLYNIRGKQIGYVFQEPSSAINPIKQINRQLIEISKLNKIYNHEDIYHSIKNLFTDLAIDNFDLRMKQYPFQLSGGLLQRVQLAMVLLSDPKLIIADEPTSSLDTINQKKLINLLKSTVAKHNSAILFITHNIKLLRNFAHRIYIMYKGAIIEQGKTEEIINNPIHPYTKNIVSSTFDSSFSLTEAHTAKNMNEKTIIGCDYFSYCTHSKDRCIDSKPSLVNINDFHKVCCHECK